MKKVFTPDGDYSIPNVIPTIKKKKKSKLGRKKIDDKKMPITIYVQESVINKLGGAIELREFLLNKIQDELIKK